MTSSSTPIEMESEAFQCKSVSADGQSDFEQTHARRMADLFRDEHARIVHLMVARTGSWAEARDVAAQAFARVLEISNPGAVSSLKAYVYRAARNLATDRAKVRAIRSRIHRTVLQDVSGTSPSPEPLLMHQQRLQVLQQAIEALRPTRRMILKLRLWDELPYSQIEARFAAEGIKVNERTLNRWYADALEKLRDAICSAEELKAEGQR